MSAIAAMAFLVAGFLRGSPFSVRNTPRQSSHSAGRASGAAVMKRRIVAARTWSVASPRASAWDAAFRRVRSRAQASASSPASVSSRSIARTRRCIVAMPSSAFEATSAPDSFARAPSIAATMPPNPSCSTCGETAASASRVAGAGSASASSRAAERSSAESRSSISAKWGATRASSGKRRSRLWQKAWIVAMRRPPGWSSTCANRPRARASVASSAATPMAASASVSGASAIAAHSPRRAASRVAISAAAARV